MESTVLAFGALVAPGVRLALAAVFLWAALTKLREPSRLANTLEQLGISPGIAQALAPTVIATELLAGLGLILAPTSWWPPVLVAGLATGFAAAGLLAVGTGKRVACSCFGSVRGRLGWRQVYLLPVWLGSAGFVLWQPGWGWNAGWNDRLITLATLLLLMIVVRLPAELGPMRRLRADRITIAPSYRPQEDPQSEEVTS